MLMYSDEKFSILKLLFSPLPPNRQQFGLFAVFCLIIIRLQTTIAHSDGIQY